MHAPFPIHFFRSSLYGVVCLALLAGACSQKPKTHPDVGIFLRLMDELREAPNESKAPPLQRLRSFQPEDPSVRLARDACVDAYSHHMKGIQAGAELKALLADAGTGAPADKDSAARLLLEMNVELEEGKTRMSLCEQRTAELRIPRR